MAKAVVSIKGNKKQSNKRGVLSDDPRISIVLDAKAHAYLWKEVSKLPSPRPAPLRCVFALFIARLAAAVVARHFGVRKLKRFFSKSAKSQRQLS
jgi:hypothetical protein